MPLEEVLDVATPMDRPAIPQQVHRATEMAQQVAQKGLDVPRPVRFRARQWR
jgi:hypothetical protein